MNSLEVRNCVKKKTGCKLLFENNLPIGSDNSMFLLYLLV